MTNDDFFRRFPDEQSCRNYLRQYREKQGIVCNRCGSINHYWLPSVEKWQCIDCRYRTSLKSGTIMHRSKLPIRFWFLCIHYMTTNRTIEISALSMMRKLGHDVHTSIWYMMHKIRIVMGTREKKYKLTGHVEVDIGHFEITTLFDKDELGNRIDKDKKIVEDRDNRKFKRGMGSERQKKVLVVVESRPVEQHNPHKKNKMMAYAKMTTVDDLNQETVSAAFTPIVYDDAIVKSDAAPSLSVIKHLVERHEPEVIPKKQAHKKLPWVHTIISNAKRKFLGVYHSINENYLQNYLNEFIYKLNRRSLKGKDSFDCLFDVGLRSVWNQ